MKIQTQSETRSETIFRHTQRMTRELRITMQAFAQTVVERYHALVPEPARLIDFRTHGDVFRCAATNAQRLQRYMDPMIDTRLPVDLEEAWVSALQGEYQRQCLADLAARYGLLAVPIPDSEAHPDLAALGRLAFEFGETFQRLAPISADGCIDAQDVAYIPAARAELRQLITAALAVDAQLDAVQQQAEERMP